MGTTLSAANIKVGMRIVYINTGFPEFIGKIATVIEIYTNGYFNFEVKWDDVDSKMDSGRWAYHYFEILEENAAQPSKAIAVNDYACPTCKNDRCSKAEKICWRCGNIL